MQPTFTGQIAAQRIAELHQQAAKQRLIHQLRSVHAASPGNGRTRAGLVHLGFRRSRPAAA
jgi:hypothetical protein